MQSTSIGLDGFIDGEEFLAWATALDNGKPLGDVALEMMPGGVRKTTDAKGLAHLPLGTAPGGELDDNPARDAVR